MCDEYPLLTDTNPKIDGVLEPGMVMTVSGEVTAKNDDSGVIDIAVMGENNIWGMHMQGTVQLALPREA